MRTRLVIGPRTRLGAALLGVPAASGEAVVAVARPHRADDRAALASVTTVSAFAADPLPPGTDAVQVHVCALGPVQARDPENADEEARVAEGLATLEWVLDAAAGRPVQVVLVSSVLVLAPGADRRHYAGWKALVEHRVRALVDAYPGEATLTVLYPGRLVTRPRPGRPWELLYTRYTTLARRMSTAPATDRARLVGLDARTWALLRAASLVTSGVTGHVGGSTVTVPASRDAHSRQERGIG